MCVIIRVFLKLNFPFGQIKVCRIFAGCQLSTWLRLLSPIRVKIWTHYMQMLLMHARFIHKCDDAILTHNIRRSQERCEEIDYFRCPYVLRFFDNELHEFVCASCDILASRVNQRTYFIVVCMSQTWLYMRSACVPACP